MQTNPKFGVAKEVIARMATREWRGHDGARRLRPWDQEFAEQPSACVKPRAIWRKPPGSKWVSHMIWEQRVVSSNLISRPVKQKPLLIVLTNGLCHFALFETTYGATAKGMARGSEIPSAVGYSLISCSLASRLELEQGRPGSEHGGGIQYFK